jgi:hypothetical protein
MKISKPSKFYLKGKDFHALSQLETEDDKIFPFEIAHKIFKLTKEETFLLSPKAYLFIFQSSSPFIISASSDQSKI